MKPEGGGDQQVRPEFSVVVPLYNEEAVLGETYRRLREVMDSTGESYELIFVDDGSRDETPAMVREICRTDKGVRLLGFSRNFGHQAAITAGMEYAAGRAVVVIDADLQDPPEVIPRMIAKWREGYDVVYGRRVARRGETFFKGWTAGLFYRLLRRLTEVDVPPDAGDFRLLDHKACVALSSLPEHNRYVRGLAAWIGFRQADVGFVREPRLAGETKYPLRKMMRLAGDAVTSFSYKPLRLAAWAGAVLLGGGVAGLVAAAFAAGPAWLPVAAAGLLGNGLTLVAVGILGEYVGRIAEEARGRPLYIVKEKVGFQRGKRYGVSR